MGRLLDAAFWIVGLLEVRSSDPVLRTFKHARRAMIICAAAQLAFLALAFTFAPDGASGVSKVAPIVEQVRCYVGNAFALAAVVCMVGMIFFTIRCLRIFFKPELYVE